MSQVSFRQPVSFCVRLPKEVYGRKTRRLFVLAKETGTAWTLLSFTLSHALEVAEKGQHWFT